LYSSPKYNENDEIREDEMGRACSMHGREEECIKSFGGKSKRKETTRKTYT
jgi:hypothetical protein